jgi:hypothetical protein
MIDVKDRNRRQQLTLEERFLLLKWRVKLAPWSLRGYAGLTLTVALGWSVAAIANGSVARGVLTLVALSVFAYFVLRGSRPVWVLVVLSQAIGLVSVVIAGGPWWIVPLPLANLALLCCRPSVSYVWKSGDPRTKVPPAGRS